MLYCKLATYVNSILCYNYPVVAYTLTYKPALLLEVCTLLAQIGEKMF